MESNRRLWLKQIGLGVAGIGLANFNSFASPTQDFFKISVDKFPIKLSSNENPYGPSPFARTAMIDNITISNRYNWQLTSKFNMGRHFIRRKMFFAKCFEFGIC